MVLDIAISVLHEQKAVGLIVVKLDDGVGVTCRCAEYGCGRMLVGRLVGRLAGRLAGNLSACRSIIGMGLIVTIVVEVVKVTRDSARFGNICGTGRFLI